MKKTYLLSFALCIPAFISPSSLLDKAKKKANEAANKITETKNTIKDKITETKKDITDKMQENKIKSAIEIILKWMHEGSDEQFFIERYASRSIWNKEAATTAVKKVIKPLSPEERLRVFNKVWLEICKKYAFQHRDHYYRFGVTRKQADWDPEVMVGSTYIQSLFEMLGNAKTSNDFIQFLNDSNLDQSSKKLFVKQLLDLKEKTIDRIACFAIPKGEPRDLSFEDATISSFSDIENLGNLKLKYSNYKGGYSNCDQ